MARPIDEILLAWTALSGMVGEDGWRSISITPVGTCTLMAGRRFPGNEEALLAGFSSTSLPRAEKLPEGKGFEVTRADPHGDGKTWLALTRKESGSIELFADMVVDVAEAMDSVAGDGEEFLLRTMLGRVRSWQEFMRTGAQTLSSEAEIGLIGELVFLLSLLEANVPASHAVEAWMGPLDGIQDFEIGTGAVEVKATLSSSGFPAKIGSLEQLDDSLRQPLFIAAVRFTQSVSGKNLPEFVQNLRSKIKKDQEAERIFSDRLRLAGYFDGHSGRYPRRFSVEDMRVVEVEGTFPRLIPGNVPNGIRWVMYEVDLDRVSSENVDVVDVLKKMGAL